MSAASGPALKLEIGPWPVFSQAEMDAVQTVLASGKVNYWTGKEGHEFEREFAAYVGAKHAVAMTNGSLTLEAALRALEIGPGDEVIVTPRSFLASVSSVAMVGATPIFADVDRSSGNLSAQEIEKVLTPKTKAIMPVHLAGYPCEMDPMLDLARSRNLHIIEDCAQSHGAMYKGKHTGTMGIIGSWSFCQDKIMSTAGEGGIVTTDNTDLWDRMWSIKDHGKKFDTVFNKNHNPGYRWLHESYGSNWRMLEIQAAVARIQLKQLESWVATRRKNAAIYDEYLSSCPVARVEKAPDHMEHAYYKYYFYVRPEALAAGWSRDRIMIEIASQGVPCFSGSCSELYNELACKRAGHVPPEPLPVAKELGEASLMLLTHPTIQEDRVRRMAEIVQRTLNLATR